MTIQTAMTALAQGHSISKVIKSILAMNTPLAKSIKEALRQGYNEDQIGEYLTKGKSLSYSQRNRMLKDMTEEEKGRGILYHQSKSEKNIGNILKSAAMSAPAIAAGYAAAPIAGAALRRAAPQIFGQGAIPGAAGMAAASNAPLPPGPNSPGVQVVNPTAPTGSPPQTQAQQTPTTNLQSPSQPPVNPVSPNITQPAQPVQPEEKISNISDILWDKMEKGSKAGLSEDDSGFMKIAKRMRTTGEIGSKEDFNKFHNLFLNERKEGKSLVDALKTATRQYDRDKYYPPEKEEQQTESNKIEPNSTVATPHGMGEVKAIRNGKALVEIDGKKHQVNEDELETSPLPEKDLADLFDELISGIEGETGEDVSRMVQWAGYNPDTNTLQFLPYTGKLYKYGNISPEDAALLTDILSVRKTSGKNFIGAWKKDSKSPIGAALSKLIRKLQSERGGKGNEYEETHEPIYSALEPAFEAKKKKKKK